MGHRATQALCVLLIVGGVLLLWSLVSEGAAGSRIAGAVATTVSPILIFAVTIQARRQNRRDNGR
jgi:hypothetical protein